ncbi:hypothetical protein K7432_012579 [Basidiobolus ranarum]|uniref:HTH APSES-type domain-containing protein n=1 Tax=Basidiobolus ranarum TaxID=34480 RepID=A0ABR2WKI5_9FUNG
MSDFSSHQFEPTSLENSSDNFEELWESNKFPNKASLPFNFETLHPDDAKDKVFAAILKALVELGNKPSSPKELANCIMKHKFTLLGGATPYATVSSRISQHFKRAIEHKPPRAPLLARSVDEKHSRKIHYYIATAGVKMDGNHFPRTPSPPPPQPLKPPKGTINVERGYPKLKIRLKKRKSNIKGTHVFKRYKTMLSGSKPGMGKGKGKWAPHTERRSFNSIYITDSSGSGSDADIDEFGLESEQEVAHGAVGSCPTIESNHIHFHGEHSPSHDPILDTTSFEPSEANRPPTNLPMDGEYSDYFEEMMNGDLSIENYDVGSPLAKQEPSASSSPPCQRASSNSINSPIYEHPTSASSTVTPEPTIRKRNGMEPEAVLLTPGTSSLFEREFDSHLIPNFDDEFNEDSALATKDSPYIPLMELNNPEMMPVSELDELLNGSPRTHKRPFGINRSTRSLRSQVIHDISLNSRSAAQRVSFHNFKQHEDHDHMVPSREDEITEADVGTFSSKIDISPMEVDTRYERISEIRPSSVTVQDHQEKSVEGLTMDGIEHFSESSLDGKTPMVVTKVYSNIKVYETVLPDTQFRLMRFHSNVSLHGDSSPENENKKRGIMLEENRHMDFCNASLLRKAAQSYVNHGKSESKDEYTRFVVIRNGPAECRGVWVSLDRARHLVEEYGIQDVPHIQQLLSDDPLGKQLGSHYDPVEMDKQLVELSGILGSAVAEYNLSQKTNQSEDISYPTDISDAPMILDPQSKGTELVDSSIDSCVDDIDPNAYISLDQDDEESSMPDSQHGSCENDPSRSTPRSPDGSEDLIDARLVRDKKSFIPTQTPTTPAIYLTVIESVPVYVTYLSNGPDSHEAIQLMRRFDTGYVNGTKLLMAGGVETESERTIVLSLEVGRIRVRKEDSKLFGTWIPLPRARALASTCSLQHKLGPFLEDKLSNYFPNPLPNSITVPKPMRLTSRLHQVLKAKASTLNTRNTIGSSIGISPQSLHPSKNFFSGPNYHIYQILGLQGSKQSKSAALSGIFGGPGVVGTHDDKNGKKWSKKVKSRFVNGKRSLKGYKPNSQTSPNLMVANNETESDLEIEEVRKTIQIQKLSDPELPSLHTSYDHDTCISRDGDLSEVDIGGSDHEDDLR